MIAIPHRTSNGPLTLTPTATLRGRPITLGELYSLDAPDGDYTHALVYSGDTFGGSTLVTARTARAVEALRAGGAA